MTEGPEDGANDVGQDLAKARHVPVLLREMLAALAPADGAQFIDGTFGAGGYSAELLAASPCRVLAIDRDPAAIAGGAALVASSRGRLTLAQGRFGDMAAIARAHGLGPGPGQAISGVDGIVLDIGVSSMQIDAPERGFSFLSDGPLDMRMGGDGPTAADIVNGADETDLAHIIWSLGDERRSRAIAHAIVKVRADHPIATTGELARIVAGVLGGRRGEAKHPATRTFQALRIHVNDELGELVRGLCAAEQLLAPGGRLAVVTFHSLEDRIVKRFLSGRAGRIAGQSRHVPQEPATDTSAMAPSFHFVNHRPAIPSPSECAANPRARSAKLRWAVRTAAPAHPLDRDALDLPPERA